METKKLLYNIVKIVLPLVLGGGILYWMYRDFDFVQMRKVVTNEMDWTWMLLSMPFGILAQTFRGWLETSFRAVGGESAQFCLR